MKNIVVIFTRPVNLYKEKRDRKRQAGRKTGDGGKASWR